jgi:hypothetical protein
MGDVLTFTNPKWARLAPLYAQPYEINCQIVYNFLDWAVPRPVQLSVFEHKWLDHLSGYRNRESYHYLRDTNEFYDQRVTEKIYGVGALPENVRWTKNG